jgi:PAS domain S-box-containing protein
MNPSPLTQFRMTETLWKAIILVLSGAVILFSVWCLSNSITTIFMHLYYFPIVLLAYRYRWKGFGLATLLALAYFGLVMVFDAGQTEVILGAAYRVLVFVGIAAVIAYLSERLALETRAARESAEIREQYISLAPAIILVLDRTGTITYLNPKGGEILECNPHEVTGKNWFDQFLPEYDRNRVKRLFSTLVAGQVRPGQAFENPVMTRGGTEKIIRWHNTVLHDESGGISGILGFGEDITGEKRVQDSLRKMQQFQEGVIANANVWISVLAPDGSTLLVWNDAAETISGYKKSDVLGKKTVWKLLYPDNDYRRKVTGEIQRILGKDDFLENFETEIRCADGSTKIIVWNTRALRDERGLVTGYIAIGRDVTAQKSAEFRAGESSRFLGTMIDTLPMPIFFKDTDGKYLGCNPPFEAYIGIKREDLTGKTVYDISPRDLADRNAAADQQLFDNPAPRQYETQVQYADGTRHDVIFYKAPFFNRDGTIAGLIGAFADITDRKRAEEVLRESEEKFRAFFTTSRDCVFITTIDGSWQDFNDAAVELFGYDSREDLFRIKIPQIYANPDDRDAHIRYIRMNGYSFEYPVDLRKKDGTIINALITTVARKDASGNIVGFQGSIRDITEQKRAEQELIQNRFLLSEAMDLAHLASWELDVLTGIFTFDDRFYAMYGTTAGREGGYQMPAEVYAREFVHPDDAAVVGEEITKAIQTADPGFVNQVEHRIIRRDGKVRTIIVRHTVTKDSTGRTIKTHGANQDITDRKIIEEKLRESEEKFRQIFSNINDAVQIHEIDPDGRPGKFLDVNDAACRMLMVSCDELLAHNPLDYATEYHNPPLSEITVLLRTTGMATFETGHRRADGTIVPVEINAHVIKLMGKTVVLSVIRDLTYRKRAEDKIRLSNVILSTQQETSPDGILIVDESGKILSFNRKFKEIWEIPQDIIDSRSDEQALSFVLGKLTDPQEFLSRVKYLYEHREKKSHEEIQLKDGMVLERYSAPMLGENNHYFGRVWYFHDITQRKQAEEKIKRSIERFRMVMDSIDALVYVADMQTYELLFLNKYGKDIWGEIEGKVCWQTIQSGQKGPCPFCTNARLVDEKGNPTGICNWEFQNTVNGHWYDCRDSAIRWLDGRIVRLEIATDITGRKNIEEALRESRQLFSDIISFLPDPTFVIDKDGNVLAWNRALEQLSSVPSKDIIGKGDHEYSLWVYGNRRPILIDLVLHPDQDAGRLDYTGIHWEGRSITAQTEITGPGTGHKITLSLVASPLIDAQGKITGAIESMRDISHLKETEAELARINQSLEEIVRERTRALEEEVAQRLRAEKDVQAALDYTRSVIEANPDLVAVLDAKGIILDINATGELLTGIPKERLIGKLYFGYMVDDGTLYTAFSGLLGEGTIENVVRIRRADGHVTPLSVHATVIRGTDGKEDRIIVAGHDITRQMQDEEAIQASLDEKVILLREIHHRVKNNLQIIISLVNLQMRQTDDPGVKQIMAETQNRVRAMSLVHEKLYRSESLSQIDFADYIRFLATQLFSFYGTDTRRVRLDLAMGKIMVDINTAVPLGLLMNELVSNALKHAFPNGREGMIAISGSDENNLITLVVRDNGIGIPAELDWKNTASLGMRLVTSLIDQIDGTITLDRSDGTTFTVTVKRNPASGGAE